MGDGPDEDAEPNGNGNGFPTCPNCGEPVTNATIVGPTDAIAGPCGCRVPPESVVDDLLDEPGDDTRDEDATDDGSDEGASDDRETG